MTSIEEVIEQKSSGLDDLIKQARAHLESIEPVDVEVVFGDQAATVRVPFIMPDDFTELTDLHPPRPGVAVDMSLWFSLSAVTAAYPGVVLIIDDVEDDLYRVREKEAVYIWPELYAVMSPEDAQNVRMAVWALHIWEPQQRLAAAKAKEAEGA